MIFDDVITMAGVSGMTVAGTGSGYGQSVSSADVSISLAGLGVSEFDLVLIFFAHQNTSNMTYGLTGYTQMADLYANDLRDVNLWAGYKVQGSTPDTSITATNMPGGTQDYQYVIFVLRGADQSTPMDATPTTNTVTSDDDIVPADITVATDGSFVLVCAACSQANAGSYSSSDPFDYFLSREDGTRLNIAVGGFFRDSGLYSPAEFVHSNTSSENFECAASVTVAVRPA